MSSTQPYERSMFLLLLVYCTLHPMFLAYFGNFPLGIFLTFYIPVYSLHALLSTFMSTRHVSYRRDCTLNLHWSNGVILGFLPVPRQNMHSWWVSSLVPQQPVSYQGIEAYPVLKKNDVCLVQHIKYSAWNVIVHIFLSCDTSALQKGFVHRGIYWFIMK